MTADPLIDPDCRAGKHAPTCPGGPCQCTCHDDPDAELLAQVVEVAKDAFSDHRSSDSVRTLTSLRDPWQALNDAVAAVFDLLTPSRHTYVNGDDGYKWLTCGLCEAPLMEVDAGTHLTEIMAADRAHTCPAVSVPEG